MSSCLSGGGRAAYGFDLDIVKSAAPSSPSPRSSSHSSSPSSTLSESSNSPLAISTKKPRTQRKRPNQTYSEAAALLAKIYPNIFSTRNLRNKQCANRFTNFRDHHHYLVEPPAELLPAFPSLGDAGFLLDSPTAAEMVPPSLFDVPKSVAESLPKSFCWSPSGSDFRDADRSCSSPASCLDDGDDDFDAESILDEEVGEGIDSIMGNIKGGESSVCGIEADASPLNYADQINPYLGHPVALKFYSGFGFAGNITAALRNVGGGDWWCSPATVEMQNIVPKLEKPPSPPEKKKKKKKLEKLEKVEEKLDAAAAVTAEKEEKADGSTARGLKCEKEDSSSHSKQQPTHGNLKPALSLKLNYDGVLKEWSGRGSPFSDAGDSPESPSDIIAKLSDIDLLSEAAGSSGLREASVLRYKEKRRSRLFSKKIRYQVRKANADQRPRTKANGRFVKRDDE